MLILSRTIGSTTSIDDIKLKIINVFNESVIVEYGKNELEKVRLRPDNFIDLGKKGRVILKGIDGFQAKLGFDCPKSVSVLRDNAHKKK